MSTIVTATVVDGQLRLDEPVDRPDGTRVRVHVVVAADDDADEHWRENDRRGLEELRRLVREHHIGSGGLKFTRDESHERPGKEEGR